MSQLDLAVEAGVSSRHLRFVETGRATPSRALGAPNAMRLMFHPKAFRPWIVNWEPTAASLIQWLHRDVATGFADAETRALLEELLAYPDTPRQWRALDLDASPAPFLPIEFRKDDLVLRYFTTLTTLGTPHDITLRAA